MIGNAAMSVESEINSDLVGKEERFLKCTSKKKVENCDGKPRECCVEVTTDLRSEPDMPDGTDAVKSTVGKSVGFMSKSNISSGENEVQNFTNKETISQVTVDDTPNKQGKKRHHSIHHVPGQQHHGSHKPLSLTFSKKRRKTIDRNPTPKFLMGGNITDPLNLNSLADEEISKVVNAIVTPMSSPLPHRNKDPDPVIVPADITDPLKLNSKDDDDNANLTRTLVTRSGKKKRKSGKGEKKEDGVEIISPTAKLQEGGLLQSTTSAIEPSRLQSLQLSSNNVKVLDKIVSPVLPDSLSKFRKRKHWQEPSSKLSRALLIDSDEETPASDSIQKHQRTASPEKRKYKRQHSKEGKTTPKFHEQNKKFQYGNYNRYYGYRNPDKDDPRLSFLKKELFAGKMCLDIGCNTGHVTLYIAKEFLPEKIVGIDIDGNLIGIARKNVKHCLMDKRKNQSAGETDCKHFPLSMEKSFGPIVKADVPDVRCPSFPSNVLFRCANFVLPNESLLQAQKSEYDVVLCLSVTKWVHLNNGDAGIKRFFRRIFLALKPGGHFILEPQAWPSYKKKKKLTETIFKNFQEIQFKPDQFKSYLLSSDVGFSSCETIGVPFSQSKGFRRPMLMFTKLNPERGHRHNASDLVTRLQRDVKSTEGRPPSRHSSEFRSSALDGGEPVSHQPSAPSGNESHMSAVDRSKQPSHHHSISTSSGKDDTQIHSSALNRISERKEQSIHHDDLPKKVTVADNEVKVLKYKHDSIKKSQSTDTSQELEARDCRVNESHQDQEPTFKKLKLSVSPDNCKETNNTHGSSELRTCLIQEPLCSNRNNNSPAANPESVTSDIALASCSSEIKNTDMQCTRYKMSVIESKDRTG